MPDKSQNSFLVWISETISATICNLTRNVLNITLTGCSIRPRFCRSLNEKKNISFIPRLCNKTIFSNTNSRIFINDFGENHNWVEISRSDGINSARGGQAVIFDANLWPVLKWVYWQMNWQKAINAHTWGAQGDVWANYKNSALYSSYLSPFCGYLHGN